MLHHMLRAAAGRGWTPNNLFANGEQGAWYEFNPENLYQDAAGTIPVAADGDPVGYIKDLSGNGNHATQSASGAKPTYRTNSALHWLSFNGSSHYILSAFSQPHPYGRFSATDAQGIAENDYIFSGGTNTRSTFYRRAGVTSNRLTMFNGANGPEITITSFPSVISEIYDGANSKLRVKGSLLSTGDAGTDSGTGISMGGGSSGGNLSSVDIYCVIQVDSGFESDIEKIESYLADLSGVTL